MQTTRTFDGLEIAIIGISAKFPLSDDYRVFWDNLAAGKELTSAYSDDELRRLGVSDEQLSDRNYVKSAANIEGKEYFDHGFFGYRPAEAALMDPQIRIFHEHCWKALEDAFQGIGGEVALVREPEKLTTNAPPFGLFARLIC